MEFIAGTAANLKPEWLHGVAQYRHKVFVETLGWKLQVENGQEWDQFDGPDTMYLAATNEEGEFTGIARLLPTHRPYLLKDVFPQLMGELPLPAQSDVWELSRFAAVDFNDQTTSPMGQFSSPVAVGLLKAVLAYAAQHGVQRLITVSPLGVERLLRRAGFAAHRAAPPIVVDGHPLFACWIEVQGGLSS